MNLFQTTLARRNSGRPPVWFMRQAGRYHSHYQRLKEKHTFMELCQVPELACETTMGPVEDFGFDAGILFSDILFPLQAMGMGLDFNPGPKLGWHLKTRADAERLEGGATLAAKIGFQGEAMRLIRKRLPADKGLLGFVGGPLTLYCYAVEGTHSGDLAESRQGIKDGRWARFQEKLIELLAENMALQARAGADTIAVMDTCAGDFDPATYKTEVLPALSALLAAFHRRCPGFPITYYAKKAGSAHWKLLEGLPIACLGVDWLVDLPSVLEEWSDRYAIQGNVDPHWLFLEPSELEKRLREVFAKVKKLPAKTRQGWICGLGHGVMPKTPESNVRLFLKLQREIFGGER